jgi:hypothetical protein
MKSNLKHISVEYFFVDSINDYLRNNFAEFKQNHLIYPTDGKITIMDIKTKQTKEITPDTIMSFLENLRRIYDS